MLGSFGRILDTAAAVGFMAMAVISWLRDNPSDALIGLLGALFFTHLIVLHDEAR